MLTPREDEVVKLIAEGHSSEEIAVALTISPKTVERHRANIQQKLGMRERTELGLTRTQDVRSPTYAEPVRLEGLHKSDIGTRGP
jgi:FixJ family two-component response regulator